MADGDATVGFSAKTRNTSLCMKVLIISDAREIEPS
jgi:hypothetical protein